MITNRYKNLFLVLLIDIILVCGAFYVSHMIRFDFYLDKHITAFVYKMLPYVVFVKISLFFTFNLYKGMWRYTSINSLLSIFKANLLSSLILIAIVLWQTGFIRISRSVFLIDLCISFLFVSGFRVLIRIGYENITRKISIKNISNYFSSLLNRDRSSLKRVLIIGAGSCGEKIFREISDNAHLQSKVVGFLDDDSEKFKREIHGVKILGGVKAVKDVVEVFNIAQIIIAIPTASAKRMRQIVNLCKQCGGVQFKTVPGMGELINGEITMSSVRDVEYRDVLGRKPVDLDNDKICSYLSEKKVLVTGAGGSIGSELCRQILRFNPDKLILFERAESPLYEIDLELKKNFPKIKIVSVLGDIQNKNELDLIFAQQNPQIVFHAAAYKHVPMLENHPWKAVENNISGTQNLVDTADKFNCKKFIFISTDKAVNPVNIMGASKRVCEMIVQNQSLITGSKTHFSIVRFGNVIGSVGSVIPLFKKQIKQGGPVTVTDVKIQRYFMLIPEACQLILQAGAMGKGNGIFVLDMGKPVEIDKIARDLIKFSGFEPDVDIKIEYTGLRPGEKLFEELQLESEQKIPTSHDKILVLKSKTIDVNILKANILDLKTASKTREYETIKKAFKQIVPESQFSLKDEDSFKTEFEKEKTNLVFLKNKI